jgi:hypothetical protein
MADVLRRLKMPKCGIELTSNDPALLSFLVRYPANPSWSVIEVESKHYLISPNFQGLTSPQEIWQAADNLLFVLNGIMKLKFKSVSLERGSTVAYFDENNQIISRTGTRSIPMRVSLSAGESYYQDADAQQTSVIDIWQKAQNNDAVLEALQHYSNQLNWFNLYKVYEVIEHDVGKITLDTWSKGRNEDFTYSANNAHASGFAARHSSVKFSPSSKRKAMSLQEGAEFISALLSQWLQTI